MRICPNCGAENEDNALKCILCEYEFEVQPDTDVPDHDNSAVPMNSDSNTFEEPAADTTVYSEIPASQARKSNSKAVIIAIASVLIVGLSIGGFFLLKSDDKKSSSSGSATKESVTSVTKEVQATAQESTSVLATTTVAETATEAATSTVTEATTAETTTATEAQTEYVDPYKAQKDKILQSVDNEYYSGKDSHLENAPSDMVFYDIDNKLEEILLSNYRILDSPNGSGKEIYSYMGTNTLKIVGENKGWYYLVEYVGSGKFVHPQYGYISKAAIVSETAKPIISATIEEENFFPDGNGSAFYLNVSGDYAYYHYEGFYSGQGETNYNCASGDTSEPRVRITAGSVFNEIRAVVTPYSSNGTAGDPVSISYKPLGANANIGRVIPCEKFGTIYSPNGSKVDGLTRSYLIDRGPESYERHDLTDGWHIKAVNYYASSVSLDAVWYELYDADDGDYYGWVNSANISFY